MTLTRLCDVTNAGMVRVTLPSGFIMQSHTSRFFPNASVQTVRKKRDARLHV